MTISTLEADLDFERLALVAQKTDNAVVITDKYGITEWVNEGFTRITEYEYQEAIGKSPGELLQGPKTDPKDVEAIRSKLKSGNSFVQEILNYAKSGRTYWLRLSITPIRNEFGEIVNYIAIESDITQEKKNKEELKKALQKSQEAEEKLAKALAEQEQLSKELMLADLRFKSTFKQEKNIEQSLKKYRSDLESTQSQLISNEKMASIGLLTAGIAHEINNPINFISSGVTSLKALANDLKAFLSDLDESLKANLNKEHLEILEGLKSDHELDYVINDIDDMLQDVETGSKRTVEIIDSLRLSARGDEEQKIPASVSSLLDASLILLKNKIGSTKIVKSYGDLEEINCLPGPLSQVFTNVLGNALQALTKDSKGTIEIKTNQKKGNQIVEIKDNGCGIPQEFHDKIFEASFTTKKVGEGTGLGMSISKEIIEKKHKGKIYFESKEGEGTTFIIQLPMS